jgi:molybdopterin converting factor small subunit
MEVKVRLYATLSHYNPEGQGNSPFKAEVAAGATVEDLLEQLGVEKGEVKQVFIRHKARPLSYQLEEGEQVAIFPPVAGG